MADEEQTPASPEDELSLRTRLAEPRRYVVHTVLVPAAQFIRTEAGSGIVLLLAAVIAVLWANSPWDEAYFELLEEHIVVDTPWFTVDESVHHWINDGLMAIFFFVVGLEIKREVIRGELASVRRATLPAAAALGGMALPALLFLAFNLGGDGQSGWGIPMATDIAFAIGLLALLGNRIPFGLKIFLLALAIVDDLGAILVIAVFYTTELGLGWLAGAVGVILLILLMQRAGVRNVNAYIAVGVALWVCVYLSGVHATLAGVVLGLLTPARPYFHPGSFPESSRELTEEYEAAHAAGDHETAAGILQQVEIVSRGTEAPLDRLEHLLHPWSSYVVIPIFALANAGLVLSADAIEAALSSSLTMGIFFGLVIGKLVGIVLVSWLAVMLGFSGLPRDTHWGHIAGSALLAGIGFTVSLFITELAFDDPALVDEARMGIFAASIVAALSGLGLLWLTTSPELEEERVTGEERTVGETA